MPKIISLIKILTRLNKTEKRYISIRIQKIKKTKTAETAAAELFLKLNKSELFSEFRKKEQASTSPSTSESEKQNLKEFIKKWINTNFKEKDKKLIHTTNINKLSSLIFDFLRQYNKDKPDFRIDRYIQDIRIYRDKKLFDEALYLIKKVREEIIDKYENHIKTQEILLLERTIKTHRASNDFKEIQSLQRQCIEQHQHTENLYQVLNDREIVLYRYREGNFKLLDSELSPIMLNTIKDIDYIDSFSFSVKMHCLFNTSLYYEHFHQENTTLGTASAQAFLYRKKAYELFKNNTDIQELQPETYHNIKVLFLNGCYQQNQLLFASNLIQEEEKRLGFSWNEDTIVEINKFSSESDFRILNIIIIFYLQSENYKRVQGIIHQTEQWLIESKIKVDNRYPLYINFSLACLLLKEYDRVERYLIQIRKIYNINKREDFILVEVLEVISLFEKNNQLENQLETKIGELIVRISKQKKSIVRKTAQEILSCLYALLINKEDKPDSQFKIKTYKQLLENLTHQQVDKTIFASFPLWLIKRIKEMEKA